MKIENFFSSADLDAIRSAVAAQEKESAAEIVPCFVERSGLYESALWRAGVLAFMIVFLGAHIILQSARVWYAPAEWEVIGASLVVALVFAGCVSLIPALVRFFAGRAALDRAVRSRAVQAFLEEEVFRTESRTGVLVFLSLFERNIHILADTGLSGKIPQAEWDQVVKGMIDRIRSGERGRAIVEAVERCGALIQKHGLRPGRTNANELPDDLRMGRD